LRFSWVDRSKEMLEIIGALEKMFNCDASIHPVTLHDHLSF